MLKEAMEYLVKMAAPQYVAVDGRAYCDRPLTVIAPPTLSMVPLLTLAGLVDLVKSNIDDLRAEMWLLHVGSFAEVTLMRKTTDEYGRRAVLARVKHDDGSPFPFGRFLDREEFVIGLQSKFIQSESLRGVLAMASSLTASTVAQADDDGVAQSVTVKRGISLKEQVAVKGRVELAPFRTFREVEQPVSEFVFRLQSKDGSVPTCALFEADGGKWKLDAVLTIKAWLEAQRLNIPVIA